MPMPMPLPSAAEEAVAASTDGTTIVDNKAAKRSREDDLGDTSSSSSQVGGEKKRKVCGDVIATDPRSETEQEVKPTDSTKVEVGRDKNDIDENGETLESKEGEIDYFVSSIQDKGKVIEMDRQDIKQQLSSGSSILILQTPSNGSSHCRANFCIPKILSGRPNIDGHYRFNLIGSTGQRQGVRSWYTQPNRFFHISCIEHLFDLREILVQGWIKMEGGISIVGLRGTSVQQERYPRIIEEWFENKDLISTIDEDEEPQEAFEIRQRHKSSCWSVHYVKQLYDEEHKEYCSCNWQLPQIDKADDFPEERKTRLLSQVLASRVNVPQIDSLSEGILSKLKDMHAKEETRLKLQGNTIEKNREKWLKRTVQ